MLVRRVGSGCDILEYVKPYLPYESDVVDVSGFSGCPECPTASLLQIRGHIIPCTGQLVPGWMGLAVDPLQSRTTNLRARWCKNTELASRTIKGSPVDQPPLSRGNLIYECPGIEGAEKTNKRLGKLTQSLSRLPTWHCQNRVSTTKDRAKLNRPGCRMNVLHGHVRFHTQCG